MYFRVFVLLFLCTIALNACAKSSSSTLFQENGVKFYPGEKIKTLPCHQLAEQVLIVYALAAGSEGKVKKTLAQQPVNQKQLKEDQKTTTFFIKVHNDSVSEHLKRCGELSEDYTKFKRKNPTPSIP